MRHRPSLKRRWIGWELGEQLVVVCPPEMPSIVWRRMRQLAVQVLFQMERWDTFRVRQARMRPIWCTNCPRCAYTHKGKAALSTLLFCAVNLLCCRARMPDQKCPE